MLIDFSQLKFVNKVKGVIHIGAHECEERSKYLQYFNNVTDNEIIWIDALSEKVELMKNLNKNIRIYNECISDKDNELVTFKITNNYQSSSFLNLKVHLVEHPDIYEIEKREIITKTLKTFYKNHNLNYDDYNFMNLDIQGAELLALQGAEDILTHIDYIYVEVNTKELYENCALLNEIDSYLNKYNFTRNLIYMTVHDWGDAFYIRNKFTLSNKFKIYYGIEDNKTDITDVAYEKCCNKNIIHIPCQDHKRAEIFGDPLDGFVKKIFITTDNDTFAIDEKDYISINIENKQLNINN